MSEIEYAIKWGPRPQMETRLTRGIPSPTPGLAVTRHPDSERLWTVTHIRSGFRIGAWTTKANALKLSRALAEVGNWNLSQRWLESKNTRALEIRRATKDVLLKLRLA